MHFYGVLPDEFIVAEWRECIAIKRQWEKGTLKHRLVSYVMDYDKIYFLNYVDLVLEELKKRNIKYNFNLYNEIYSFCISNSIINNYPEHNDRYLRQCYYNLEEKHDRGIITDDEWDRIVKYYAIKNVANAIKILN